MSDREEIDVIKSEKNSDGKDIYSSDKNDQAIRQDPLTHSNAKTEKKGLFERLKRAFSTEDTDNNNENGDDEVSDGLDDTEGNILKSIINKVSKSANKHDTEVTDSLPPEKEKSEQTDEDKHLDTEEKAEQPQTVEEPETEPEQEYDSEEEAEFAMINAILDGESIDDMEFPDDKEETSTEHSAEENDVEDVKPENTEDVSKDNEPDKAEITSNEDNTEESKTTPEDNKPEEKETASEDNKPEEKETRFRG